MVAANPPPFHCSSFLYIIIATAMSKPSAVTLFFVKFLRLFYKVAHPLFIIFGDIPTDFFEKNVVFLIIPGIYILVVLLQTDYYYSGIPRIFDANV